jgi:hypothetical protein
MRPMTLDATNDKARREALRCLGEQAMAEPARIWEELESQGIDVTPGVIYQAISQYNLQRTTPGESQGAEAVMAGGTGISLKDVECVLSIAGKAGGVRPLMRLLRRVERLPG